MTAARDATAAPQPGLLQPLRHGGFAVIAAATLVSNVGVWMRDTTSAWTVASGPGHHAAVALVQAATTFPVFVLALPAGVMADHYDRRRLLVGCQLALAAVGATLAWLSWYGMLTPGLLVLLALCAGSAAALAAPAWQAIVPSLVPRDEIASAVAVSSIGFNIARVVGPAVGGLLLAAAGPAASYACNALAYGATLLALLAVAEVAPPHRRPDAFRFGDELQAGFHFVAVSPAFRAVLGRAAALFLLVSSYLTLLPLLAHDRLAGSASGYGTLLGAIGLGSLAGGVVLSAAHRHGITDQRLLGPCALAEAAALALLSQAHTATTACLALAVTGAATLIQLAAYNAAQLLLPDTIRGRGLAIYMAVSVGAMSLGSLVWGALSEVFSIAAALILAAAGFAATGLWALRSTPAPAPPLPIGE